MSTEYNPTEKNPSPPAREFTEQEVARCFGPRSDSAAAHEAGKNPARYERMKRLAIADKLIPDWTISQPWLSKDYRDRFKEAPLTEAQIKTRALTSLEEVDSYYVRQSTGDQNNLSKLAADKTPAGIEKFQRIRAAAMEYGRIPRQETPRLPESKAPERPTLLTLPEETCDRIGVKRGTQVDDKQYLTIVTTINQIDEQRARVAAQAAKDAAVDESVSTFGAIRELPDSAKIAAGMHGRDNNTRSVRSVND